MRHKLSVWTNSYYTYNGIGMKNVKMYVPSPLQTLLYGEAAKFNERGVTVPSDMLPSLNRWGLLPEIMQTNFGPHTTAKSPHRDQEWQRRKAPGGTGALPPAFIVEGLCARKMYMRLKITSSSRDFLNSLPFVATVRTLFGKQILAMLILHKTDSSCNFCVHNLILLRAVNDYVRFVWSY